MLGGCSLPGRRNFSMLSCLSSSGRPFIYFHVGSLTLDEFSAVRAVGNELLERVATGSVGVVDRGLIDLDLVDHGGCVLFGHG